MAGKTPISRKPVNFYVPIVAAFGALAGLFVGTAQGSGFLGLIIGAVLLGAMAFVATQIIKTERPTKWGFTVLLAVGGLLLGGIPGLVIGALFGWFFGWLTWWLYEGRYREKLAPYLTPGQVLWHFTFRVICGAIFVFLITPILVVMPLSFNSQDFFGWKLFLVRVPS